MNRNKIVILKYQEALYLIIKNTNGEKVFTYKDINVDWKILVALQKAGIIKKMGKKRINHQFVNTYYLSQDQRVRINEILGEK
jgi:hypothetical protein